MYAIGVQDRKPGPGLGDNLVAFLCYFDCTDKPNRNKVVSVLQKRSRWNVRTLKLLGMAPIESDKARVRAHQKVINRRKMQEFIDQNRKHAPKVHIVEEDVEMCDSQ